jgi:hypothetical protein
MWEVQQLLAQLSRGRGRLPAQGLEVKRELLA